MNLPDPTRSAATLKRECDVFCRYLTGRAASAFLLEKFAEAHARDTRYHAACAFDRVLLALARKSPFLAQCADSYACVAARASLLRKKLVLLMAILESSSPEHGFDEHIADTPPASVIRRVAGRGGLFALRLAVVAVILAPVHFVLSLSRGWGERE